MKPSNYECTPESGSPSASGDVDRLLEGFNQHFEQARNGDPLTRLAETCPAIAALLVTTLA